MYFQESVEGRGEGRTAELSGKWDGGCDVIIRGLVLGKRFLPVGSGSEDGRVPCDFYHPPVPTG